ncbi:type VI secretion system tube protein Hcp [Corticibacter populi]|uniref:Type VI secretion system tube protein Hcp n=1 Tax=Corticibacter populi TaxID=1550736 RepID=A0A3M6QMD8_9BURK|nr:type VI secretion system tube protein Hcp [Corticibacter populi]RMX04243.1 type VI secretion system tube protein Hcp [Corticibacter populi]RZS33282.1 type VI secretion system secreted protein Hcp [Corticibacter populi]
MSNSDFFLDLDGIEGESTDQDFKGKIEIETFSFGVSNEGTMAKGGGGGTGKAQFQNISIGKSQDKASPKLFKAAATGDHIKKAVISGRKASGKGNQYVYLTYTLEDVMVTGYSTSATQGDAVVRELVTLDFARIKVEYKPQKADGTPEGAVAAGYDRAINKAS